jgi:recombination protein RecT
MSTAVTTTTGAKPTLRQHLESPAFMSAVAKALPKHLTPDRFIRVALTAITRTPKLASCDQASFFSSLLTLSQLGLEPDGRRAHLIPFENRKRGVTECQLIIDYKGLAELAYRSGQISTLHADVVRDGDLFTYSAGKLEAHVPWFLRKDGTKPAAEGEVIAVYATAEFRDGSRKTEVLSRNEVEAVRQRSRAGGSGPWVSDWSEMAKKTAFRRLSKWLPLSPELRDAFESDDDQLLERNVTPVSDKIGAGLSSMIGDGLDAIPAETADVEDVPYPDAKKEGGAA